MRTSTVAALAEALKGLVDRGYGEKPVYIDIDGSNSSLLRFAYRVQVVVNSKDDLIAVIDSVER